MDGGQRNGATEKLWDILQSSGKLSFRTQRTRRSGALFCTYASVGAHAHPLGTTTTSTSTTSSSGSPITLGRRVKRNDGEWRNNISPCAAAAPERAAS